MVNLPPQEQDVRVVERRTRIQRSHHNWGARLSRRDGHRREPRNLLELEELAERTVQLMQKHSPKSKSDFSMAMDLLRCQYNLNFMMLCEKCHGTHLNDELSAPER